MAYKIYRKRYKTAFTFHFGTQSPPDSYIVVRHAEGEEPSIIFDGIGEGAAFLTVLKDAGIQVVGVDLDDKLISNLVKNAS